MRSSQFKQPAKHGGRAMSSAAWLLCGISSIPGELRLSGEVLSFTAHDTGTAWDWQLKKLENRAGSRGFADSLKSGKRAELFREKLAEVCVRSPWYYFSGGLVAEIREQKYRVSFGRPARASIDDDELQTVRSMRRAGKQWLRVLSRNRQQ